jgi:lysozyme
MASKRTLTAIIGATAAALVMGLTPLQEGRSNNPYRDTGGVWTVCDGQTGVPMRYYTNAQCDAMLANTLANVASQVEAITPGYASLPDGVKAATIDFTYNVGIGTYSKSTYRKMLSAREVPAACDQLLRYKFVGALDCSTSANRNQCGGVWTRRQAERTMCRGE